MDSQGLRIRKKKDFSGMLFLLITLIIWAGCGYLMIEQVEYYRDISIRSEMNHER